MSWYSGWACFANKHMVLKKKKKRIQYIKGCLCGFSTPPQFLIYLIIWFPLKIEVIEQLKTFLIGLKPMICTLDWVGLILIHLHPVLHHHIYPFHISFVEWSKLFIVLSLRFYVSYFYFIFKYSFTELLRCTKWIVKCLVFA